MSDRPPSSSQLQQSLQAGDLLDPGVSLHWEQCGDYPMRIYSSAGSVFFNGKLYITTGGGGPSYDVIRSQLFVYTPSEDSWEIIPTPAGCYALATYRSQLVLVGRGSQAGKVWLLEDGRRWVPHPTIPALPHSSSVLAAVGFDDYLLALVEEDISPGTETVVKLYNGQTWFTGEVSEPLLCVSSVPLFVVNGDDLYLWWYTWHAVRHVSLQSVVASAVTPGAPPAQWEELPSIPFYGSSITWFGGRLLAVGGFPGESTVHAYNHTARKWEHVSDVPGDSFQNSCCAVLPTGELLVVGGYHTSTRVLKATITVSHTAESLSLATTSGLFHYLEQAVAGLVHKRNKKPVQSAMGVLAALKERLAAKEGEHFHQRPAPGIPTDPPLKAGGLEARVKAESLLKHFTSSDHITEAFDILEKTLLQPQVPTGSEVSLMLDTLSAAREEYWTTLEHTEELEDEIAMLKYKLLRSKLPPEEQMSDIKPLVKPEIPVKQEMKHEEMMSVAEPTSATPTVADLRGVEAIAETFVRVTRAGRSFHWAGYGLKLTFPPNCLPPGVEECIIRIQASISGQYQLPEGTALVSAVYWFKCKPQITFKRPLTLEIQNCAKPENVPKLKFYRASSSQQELPYSFQPLENGVFTKHSSYGSVELDQFCGVTVGQEETEERNCCASLFYLGDSERKKQIEMVISLDLEVCITAVLEEYAVRNALVGSVNTIEFEADQISLQVGEGIEKDGWKLTAIDPPCVERRQVENFKPGKVLPLCKLLLRYRGSVPPPEFEHRLGMSGAKKPKDYITILSELISPVTASQSLNLRKRRREESQATSTVLRGKHKLSEDPPSIKRIKQEALDLASSALPPASPALQSFPQTYHIPPPTPRAVVHLPPPSMTTVMPTPYQSFPFSYNVQNVYQQAGPSSYLPQQRPAPIATPQAVAVPTLRDYQNCLPAEVATTTPSSNDISHIATAMNDWKGLCYIMGFTDADQAAINDNNSTIENKRTAVLDLWKRRRGSAAATFAELVSMAYQANDLTLVERIIEVASFPRSH